MNSLSRKSHLLNRAARVVGLPLISSLMALPILAGPQSIENLARAGFLTAPAINPPVVTLTAGERFLGLVPASRQELCQIELQYYVGTDASVKTVRIVNAGGQVLLTCGA